MQQIHLGEQSSISNQSKIYNYGSRVVKVNLNDPLPVMDFKNSENLQETPAKLPNYTSGVTEKIKLKTPTLPLVVSGSNRLSSKQLHTERQMVKE